MSAGIIEGRAAEWIPENLFAPLDLAQAFPLVAPIEIDLGCGDGAFLAALAAENPGRNFLGLERLAGRVRSACHKLTVRGLTNARVLRVEISYATERLLPPGSVAGFHLMFADPWPKRRHHRRRIFTDGFLQTIALALTDDGFIKVATDHWDYFQQIERIALRSAAFQIESSPGLTSGPVSAFERRFQVSGAPIHRLLLRKTS